jgi:hypothetical protein
MLQTMRLTFTWQFLENHRTAFAAMRWRPDITKNVMEPQLTPQFTCVDNRDAVVDAAFAPDSGIARAFWRRWRGQLSELWD